MTLLELKKQGILRKFQDQCDLIERTTKTQINQLEHQVKKLETQRRKLEDQIKIEMKKSKNQLNIFKKEKQQAEIALQAEINEWIRLNKTQKYVKVFHSIRLIINRSVFFILVSIKTSQRGESKILPNDCKCPRVDDEMCSESMNKIGFFSIEG